jgi:hypothetical protein
MGHRIQGRSHLGPLSVDAGEQAKGRGSFLVFAVRVERTGNGIAVEVETSRRWWVFRRRLGWLPVERWWARRQLRRLGTRA